MFFERHFSYIKMVLFREKTHMKETLNKLLKYPRPLFRRESFISLDGEWDFLLERSGAGEREPRYKEFPKDHLKIKVPFAYQSPASGINDKSRCDEVWYQKDFVSPHKRNERVILHIGAADYETYLYVNEKLVGKHLGGYTAFSFDITDYLKDDKAHIAICCLDSYNIYQPRGKQKWKNENFECWYQEITGIWKSVWVEVVPYVYLLNAKMTPNKEGAIDIELDVNDEKYQGFADISIKFKDKHLVKERANFSFGHACAHILIKEIHYWDLENPNLYDVIFELSSGDIVKSQFGYRFIETDKGQIYLNGEPCFMRLTLEQGYYPAGIYTFKDIKEMIDEVNLIKDCGFNGLRMHQKVEDERFYYLCDLMGLIVWSEMPSCYGFNDHSIENNKREWQEILKEHYNHPSILVWTPCNESWGVPGIRHTKEQQQFLVDLYDMTKAYDKTRLVVSNDGWSHCKTDLITLHNYIQEPERFKEEFIDILMDIVKKNKPLYKDQGYVPFADGYKYEGQPILIDEFCGIGFNVDEVNNGWGYGNKVKGVEEFLDRYNGLVKLASDCPLLAGWCMTQISDVYQEVNGLVTFERKEKFPLDELMKINRQKS